MTITPTQSICLWSGPRNVSTALMYAFAQRKDTIVFDEPLYAHYLRVSDAIHPGREAILNSMEQNGEKVVQDIILGQYEKPISFHKQMAHHLVDLDESFMAHTTNLLLIRDPAEVIVSFSKIIETPVLDDIGIKRQYELYQHLRNAGQHPVVLDGQEILKDPEKVLRKTCSTIGIPFDAAMLSWDAKARPEDGVWAPYWYSRVHQTTGFAPWEPKETIVPARFEALYAEAKPYYEALYAQAIKGGG